MREGCCPDMKPVTGGSSFANSGMQSAVSSNDGARALMQKMPQQPAGGA